MPLTCPRRMWLADCGLALPRAALHRAHRAHGPPLSDSGPWTVSWGLAGRTACLLPLAHAVPPVLLWKPRKCFLWQEEGVERLLPERIGPMEALLSRGPSVGRLLSMELGLLSHAGTALGVELLDSLLTAVGRVPGRVRMLVSLAAPLAKQPIWLLLRKPDFLSAKCFECASIGKS